MAMARLLEEADHTIMILNTGKAPTLEDSLLDHHLHRGIVDPHRVLQWQESIEGSPQDHHLLLDTEVNLLGPTEELTRPTFMLAESLRQARPKGHRLR